MKEAECLLYSEKLEDSERGETLLYKMASRYIEARFLLGFWIIKTFGGDNSRIKTGISLINSAYYESDRNAAYLMAYMYEKNGKKYGIKNHEKAIKIMRDYAS